MADIMVVAESSILAIIELVERPKIGGLLPQIGGEPLHDTIWRGYPRMAGLYLQVLAKFHQWAQKCVSV